MPGSRRGWWIALLLCLLSLGLRVDWHLAFRELPLYHAPAIDEALHWEWAQELAAGEGSPERPYFRAPGYPWWLGLLQRGGLGLAGLRWAGTLLGLLSLGLVTGLAWRTLGRTSALWTLALCGLSGAWIYYEPQLLLEHQVLFLLAAATLAWLRLREHAPGWADLLWGLLLALAAWTRPNALLLAPWALCLLLRLPESWDLRLKRLTLFGLGWLPPLLLVAGLNGWPGSGVFLASQGGVNLWIGNNPQADGRSAVLPGVGHAWEREDATRLATQALGHSPTPGEEDAYYRRLAVDWSWGHLPAALSLSVRKAAWLLGPRELGNNTSPPSLAARRPWMGALLALSWGCLAWPGLLGLALGFPRHAALRRWLTGAVLLYAASFLPFFLTGRFRLPLLALLAWPAADLLAFLGTARGPDWIRWLKGLPAWRLGLAGGVALCLACAWLFEARQLGPDQERAQAGWQEFQLGNAWLRLDKPDSARVAFEGALRLAPALPEVRLNLGILESVRQPERAESLFLAELQVDPASAKAWNNLGGLRLGRAEVEGARECFRQALRLRPGLADARWNLGLAACSAGLAALQEGRLEDARAALAEARSTPYRGKGWSRLAGLSGGSGADSTRHP